jgi:hypothetical protein
MQYLRTFNKLDMKPETSQLPSFLLNENKFCIWMKLIAGHTPKELQHKQQQQQQQQQKVQLSPPVPLAPRPPQAAVVHRTIVSRVIPPRVVPPAPTPPPPPSPPPPPPQPEKPSLLSKIFPFGGDMPPPFQVKPEILASLPRLPSPATVRKHAVVRKVVTAPLPPARSVAFTLSEPPQVLFHCGDPAITRKEISRKTKI